MLSKKDLQPVYDAIAEAIAEAKTYPFMVRALVRDKPRVESVFVVIAGNPTTYFGFGESLAIQEIPKARVLEVY